MVPIEVLTCLSGTSERTFRMSMNTAVVPMSDFTLLNRVNHSVPSLLVCKEAHKYALIFPEPNDAHSSYRCVYACIKKVKLSQ
jgi:hypothetical protein